MKQTLFSYLFIENKQWKHWKIFLYSYKQRLGGVGGDENWMMIEGREKDPNYWIIGKIFIFQRPNNFLFFSGTPSARTGDKKEE